MDLGSWGFYLESAESAKEAGNDEQACKMYQRAIEKAIKSKELPKNIQYLFLDLFDILKKLNDDDLAEQVFQKGLGFYKSRGRVMEKELRQFYTVYSSYLAERVMFERNAEVAKSLYDLIVKNKKIEKFERLMGILGYAVPLQILNRVDEAAAVLEDVERVYIFDIGINQLPGLVWAYKAMCQIYLEAEKYEEAEECARKVVEDSRLLAHQDPSEHFNAIFLHATVMYKKGERDEALDHIQFAVEWVQDRVGDETVWYGDVLVGASVVYQQMGEFEQALSMLEGALEAYQFDSENNQQEIEEANGRIALLHAKKGRKEMEESKGDDQAE